MALGKEKEGGNYISFKPSIGRLVIKSDSSDPEAKPRTYKDSKTGQDVTVYEQRFQDISGKIVGLKTDVKGEFGPQLMVVIRETDSGKDYILPIALNKKWGTKVAEKIASGKLDENFYFNAFPTFKDSKGEDVEAGVSVQQNGNKLYSRFNYQENNKWVLKENYPAYPEKDTIPVKEDNPTKYTKFWDKYYSSVSEFLIDWFDKNLTIEYTAPARVDSVEEEAETEVVPF